MLLKTKWTELVGKSMTPSQGRTLRNYMNLAKSNIDKKFYFLGEVRLIKIIGASDSKKVGINDVLESIIQDKQIDIVNDDINEIIRHVDKVTNCLNANKKLSSEKVQLTEEETTALREATNNGYKLTKQDTATIVAEKTAGKDVVEFLNDKKLPPIQVKKGPNLTLEAKLANFREELSPMLTLVKSAGTQDIVAVDKELREDMVVSLRALAELLEQQIEDTAAPQDEE